MPFILEGLITTRTPQGEPHLAPMGPEVSLLEFNDMQAAHFERLVLKPYKTSTTLANLLHHRAGIFQLTDHVEIIARAAIGKWDHPPQFIAACKIPGEVIQQACSWYEFELVEVDLSQERTRLIARIVHQQIQRPFLGFNRARHAVIEAAILATRVKHLPITQILEQLDQLQILIEKTASDHERMSFRMLHDYVLNHARQS